MMDNQDRGDERHGLGQKGPRQNQAASFLAGKAKTGRAHVVANPVGYNHDSCPVFSLAGRHDDVDDGVEAETGKGRSIKGLARDGGRNSGSSRSPKVSHQAAASPARPSLLVRMASSLKTFLACSLLAFVSVRASIQRTHSRDTAVIRAAAPVVAVKNGSYEGVYSPEYDQDFFLGMRYAQVCTSVFCIHPALSHFDSP